jgi:hypothetical protein
MGLFFLVVGSLTPKAMARRGAAGFLRERLVRLGLPLLVFILVLGQLTVVPCEANTPLIFDEDRMLAAALAPRASRRFAGGARRSSRSRA